MKPSTAHNPRQDLFVKTKQKPKERAHLHQRGQGPNNESFTFPIRKWYWTGLWACWPRIRAEPHGSSWLVFDEFRLVWECWGRSARSWLSSTTAARHLAPTWVGRRYAALQGGGTERSPADFFWRFRSIVCGSTYALSLWGWAQFWRKSRITTGRPCTSPRPVSLKPGLSI